MTTKKKSGMGTRQKKRTLKKFIRQNTTRSERRAASRGWKRGGRKSGEHHEKPLTGSSRVPQHVVKTIKAGKKIKKWNIGDYPEFIGFADEDWVGL